MHSDPSYDCTEYPAQVGDKEITVHSLVPVFSGEDDKKRARQETERNLYQIFSKYVKP